MQPRSDQPFKVHPWDLNDRSVILRYESRLGPFEETIDLGHPIEPTPITTALLDMLAVVAAASYVKASGESVIDATGLRLSESAARMAAAALDDGMAEFAHTNDIDRRPVFEIAMGRHHGTPATPTMAKPQPSSLLIPIGGGKDSAVVTTALTGLSPTLLSIGHNRFAERIAGELGLTIKTVTRGIDPALLAANAAGAPNGHVPVTAINSLIALVFADLHGHDAVVMANEHSSSEPTRIANGRPINHQYSKSARFEDLLRHAVADAGSPIAYFSALRDRDDEAIARVFARHCTRLHPHFMSCNQAMLRDPERRSDRWCNRCAKCRSVFLSLAPHLEPAGLVTIFGHDLLDDESQIPGFGELIDPGNKPFECVSDIRSANIAMRTLRDSPAWRDHRVVRAVDTNEPLVATPRPTMAAHHVPPALHSLLDGFFSR